MKITILGLRWVKVASNVTIPYQNFSGLVTIATCFVTKQEKLVTNYCYIAMDKNRVFEACQEILEEGKSVTVRAVSDRIGGSSRDISPVVKEFKEGLEKEANSAMEVSQKDSVSKSQSSGGNPEIPDPMAEIGARADKKAQYMAAGEIVLTQELYRHYRKTAKFSDPDVQKQVDEARSRTADDWEEETENFSPAAMLARFGK